MFPGLPSVTHFARLSRISKENHAVKHLKKNVTQLKVFIDNRQTILVIVLIITNTPLLEQGRQQYIYMILSILYIQYVSDLFVCLILSDQNKS